MGLGTGGGGRRVHVRLVRSRAHSSLVISSDGSRAPPYTYMVSCEGARFIASGMNILLYFHQFYHAYKLRRLKINTESKEMITCLL